MAKAYASPSSSYYKNEALLTDIVNILDWLTDNCYYPRSETDTGGTGKSECQRTSFRLSSIFMMIFPKSKAANL